MSDSKPTPDSRERELFIQALEHPSPSERAAFLASACGEDLALKARVEAAPETISEPQTVSFL
jgi:hypothetical protein